MLLAKGGSNARLEAPPSRIRAPGDSSKIPAIPTDAGSLGIVLANTFRCLSFMRFLEPKISSTIYSTLVLPTGKNSSLSCLGNEDTIGRLKTTKKDLPH